MFVLVIVESCWECGLHDNTTPESPYVSENAVELEGHGV